MHLTIIQAWFDAEVAKRPVTVFVWYRGAFCLYCRAYMRSLQKLLPAVQGAHAICVPRG